MCLRSSSSQGPSSPRREWTRSRRSQGKPARLISLSIEKKCAPNRTSRPNSTPYAAAASLQVAAKQKAVELMNEAEWHKQLYSFYDVRQT